MKKLKILCIVGGSGCGKTTASLHLKNHCGANVICSFTTRKPRAGEVDGVDHIFVDAVPDKDEMIAYTFYGGAHYYALKSQVYGDCTVYVIDEKGLVDLIKNFDGIYDIHTVLIKRSELLRRRVGVDIERIRRDRSRVLVYRDYDHVIQNNKTKGALLREIERIYEEVKKK